MEEKWNTKGGGGEEERDDNVLMTPAAVPGLLDGHTIDRMNTHKRNQA